MKLKSDWAPMTSSAWVMLAKTLSASAPFHLISTEPPMRTDLRLAHHHTGMCPVVCLRHVEWLGEFPDRGLALAQTLKDRSPGWVRKSAEHKVETR